MPVCASFVFIYFFMWLKVRDYAIGLILCLPEKKEEILSSIVLLKYFILYAQP